LRGDLLKARVAGAISEIQLPVESMTVELTVTATRTREGKAGFKVPIVPVELGGVGQGPGVLSIRHDSSGSNHAAAQR
jgi:Trypsin-co-occurring domain 2